MRLRVHLSSTCVNINAFVRGILRVCPTDLPVCPIHVVFLSTCVTHLTELPTAQVNLRGRLTLYVCPCVWSV